MKHNKSVVYLSSPLRSGGFGCLCPERQIACQASAFTVAPCRYWDRAHARQSLLGQGAMPVGNAHMCSALKEGDVLILGHTHTHTCMLTHRRTQIPADCSLKEKFTIGKSQSGFTKYLLQWYDIFILDIQHYIDSQHLMSLRGHAWAIANSC